VYTLTASANGYLGGELMLTVEEDRQASPAFELNPMSATTILTGKVSDRKTGDPLAATVSFPGTMFSPVSADAGTGVYKAELPAGSYAVAVEAEDYIKQTAAVSLEKDRSVIKDFVLVKVGMRITLRGVYFDFNKMTIKPEMGPALDDAAKFLRGNPDIRIELQGHTDSIGSEQHNLTLSKKRAEAVRNCLVDDYGISADRLKVRGYGESRPIATNETRQGRALNNRVEMEVVGR
jgi:outer membrane protein OmpA-like peptidoglycan-associated protein